MSTKDKHKFIESLVEKLKSTDLNNISAGFVGKDWSQRYADIYNKLGIEHERNTFSKDKYTFAGETLPRSFVYSLVDILSDPNDKELHHSAVKNLLDNLQDEIKSGSSQTLDEIKKKFG